MVLQLHHARVPANAQAEFDMKKVVLFTGASRGNPVAAVGRSFYDPVGSGAGGGCTRASGW